MLDSKIIKAFDEAKTEIWNDDDIFEMGYNNGLEAGKNICLEMFGDKETVKPEVYLVANNYTFYRCPRCKISWYYKGNFCSNCGVPVEWD